MRTFAVINQKGGVGKTTTAVNLSAALSEQGNRVALIDIDPQAHATLHFGLEIAQGQPSLYDVLCNDASLASARTEINDKLCVIGGNIDLAAAEVELAGVQDRDLILRKKLAEEAGDYDFVIIDCPPSLGILTINALAAVTEVVLPMQPHFLALHGLSKLLQTIHIVAGRLNDQLSLTGVVFCMYESGTRLAAEVSSDVGKFFEESRGQNVPWSNACAFQTKIRRNIRLAEAPSFGRSIFDYAPASHGAEDYRKLATELLAYQPARKRSAA
ncbi:MAG: ParA family protein [Pirellulales bacterium]|nr:ParA family protein [Pirellulales bacterium]